MTQPDRKRLGLTGSIGSGKSTVARLLRERGLTVLDADAAAHEVSGSPEVRADVARELGPQYVTETGLDRPALATLVFTDPEKRKVLNGIIHPRVRARMNELERQAPGTWVVHDIPLLFEGGLEKQMTATLLVDAPLDVRVRRVMQRDPLSEEQVIARDRAQMPPEEKRRRASIVLDNSGSLSDLERQLDVALASLGVSAAGTP